MPFKVHPLIRVSSVLFLLFFSSQIFAQKTITGKVASAANKPVAGASVQVIGTSVGTITTEDGSFSLNVPAGKNVITISALGFKKREVNIENQTTFAVALEEDVSDLSEVVVTGYSSQQRRNIAGAVSTVKGEQLASVQTGNPEQQLQGRAPGVTVITSGQPGTTSQVRIRGFGSFTNNEPLYVVDGIPTTNIDFLNGNDIESTTILKDAASASIYGARAAAGVIIVTTKKAKYNSKFKVTYDGTFGVTTPGNGLSLLSPQQQADLTWEALKAAGQTLTHPQYGTGATPVIPDYLKVGDESGLSGLASSDPRLDPAKFNTDFEKGPIYQVIKANKQGTDWYDALTNTGNIQNHTLGFTGGSDNSRYYAGLSYYDEQGTVINTSLKKITLRLNSEFKVKEFIRFGNNFQYTYRQNPNIGGPAGENDIMFALTINPLLPVRDEGGGYGGTTAKGFNNSTNPVARRERSLDNRGYAGTLFGNIYAEVDFLKHFTLRSSFGGTMSQFQNRFINYRTYENSENVGSNTFGEGAGTVAAYTATNTVAYKNQFGRHNINAIAGIEAVSDGYFRGLNGSGLNPFTTSFNFTTLTNTDPNGRNLSSAGNPFRKLYSQFAKVDYVFDDRFIVSGTIRRDGSSVFGEDNRYGVFPAGSVAWRISSESFMKNIKWINELKVRGGYGIMGNERPIGSANRFNSIGGSSSTTAYDIGGSNTSTSPGLATTGLGDPNVKWEENATANIGFDGTFFNNKLDVILDVYQRKTTDLLFRQALPGTLGNASAPTVNVGSMENKGIDIMVTYKGGRAKALRYEADVIFTSYANEITQVSDVTNYFDVGFTNRIGGGIVRNVVGQPVSTFYGYKVIGLFKDASDVSSSPTQTGSGPGRFKYADVNNDKIINDQDRTYIGNPNPDFTYGFNTRLFFKNFDMEALFYGVQGADVLNFTKWFTDFYPSFAGIGKSTRVLDAWTPNNTDASVPRFENISNPSTNGELNSYYVENSSYFRLRSLKIGYNFSPKMLSKVGMDKIHFYIQGTNLFTSTKYTGTDPAVSGADTNFGVDIGNYPVNKQFLVGVNIGL
ncbi:MAG: TonB-dependent receptor [Bacteroidota bacterium]